MNIFNVHSNKSSVDSQVKTTQYFRGKFINANLDKALLKNKRNVLIITANNGKIVTCVQIVALIARRIFFVM